MFFLRDLEKIEYALNVCQFRWRKSIHFAKSQLKSKTLPIPYAGGICDRS